MRRKQLVGIYLAAGKSRRMGTNKLTLPLRKTTVGSLGLKAALESRLDHVVVVAKADDQLEWIDPVLFTSPFRARWHHISCMDVRSGQAYSLRSGIEEGKQMNAAGAMVLLADQPFVSVELINDLIAHYENHRSVPFIAASFRGILRPPILFSDELFPSLLRLEGDEGARQLLRRNSAIIGIPVEHDDEQAFYDIDTKEDYERVKEESGDDYCRGIAGSCLDTFQH